MKYFSEKSKQKMLDDAESFLRDSDNELFEQLIEISLNHQHIRGKLTRDKSPRYNTYVRSLTADLLLWMNSVEELLMVLAVELYKERQSHEN